MREILYAYAVHEGIYFDSFEATAECESGLNPKAFAPQDGHGGSRGIFQFQTATFKRYAPLAGVENPDIWNPIHQIQTAAYMFGEGEQGQWTCFRKLAVSSP